MLCCHKTLFDRLRTVALLTDRIVAAFDGGAGVRVPIGRAELESLGFDAGEIQRWIRAESVI
jgi:hypothetical protein